VAPDGKSIPADVASVTNELVKRLNEYSIRIRNIEQRLERMESRIEDIEETVLNQMGGLRIGLEKISQNFSSFSDRLTAIENEVLRMNKELSKTALKSDIKKIETFIDVVNPVTSKFVTKEEVERLLEETVKRKV